MQIVHPVSAYWPATGTSGQYGSQAENNDLLDCLWKSCGFFTAHIVPLGFAVVARTVVLHLLLLELI
jgi:hypothetical protein